MSICSMVEGECCAGEAGRRIMLLLLSCGAGEVTSRWLSHSIASVEVSAVSVDSLEPMVSEEVFSVKSAESVAQCALGCSV